MTTWRICSVGFLIICAVVSSSYAQSIYTILHEFGMDDDGDHASGDVLIVDDVLYGLTRYGGGTGFWGYYGGTNDGGMVYSFKLGFACLNDFDG